MPVVVALGIEIGFDLIAVCVALVGLCIIAAVTPLGSLFQQWLLRLPWPLAQAASAGASALEAAIGASVRWTEASAAGLANAIVAPWQALWTVARMQTAAVEHLRDALWRVNFWSLPRLQALLEGEIVAAYWAAVGAAQAYYASAIQHADVLAGQAEGLAAEIGISAFQHADQVGELVLRLALQQVAQAIARADGEFVEAVRQADAGAAAVAVYAEQLAAQGLEYAQRVAAADEALIDRALRDALGYTQQVAGVLAADLAAVEARVGAYAGALVAPVALAVQALEDLPCIRACAPLGDLGQLLQLAEDTGLALLLLALAAELARDPQGGAQELWGLLSGLVGGLVTDVAGEADQAPGPLAVFERFGGPARAA